MQHSTHLDCIVPTRLSDVALFVIQARRGTPKPSIASLRLSKGRNHVPPEKYEGRDEFEKGLGMIERLVINE